MQFPDYPFTSIYATINSNRMHYLDEGNNSAEPIVMVHGNPSWSFFFRKPVLALRGSFRCIVPDHIGMGLSDKPTEEDYDYTLLNRIDDLEALLLQIDAVENITLILHDWGGMIGMGYACRYPQRIKRLIIMNTAAFHLPQGMYLPWQLKLARSPLGPLLIQGLNAFCRVAVKKCVVRQPMSQDVSNAYLTPNDTWSHRLAVLRFIQDIPLQSSDRAYAVVSEIDAGISQFKTTPMLLCWGLKDFIFNEGYLDEWCQRFPNSVVNSFADAGHYLLEDAADEVVPLIQDFLIKHPLTGS